MLMSLSFASEVAWVSPQGPAWSLAETQELALNVCVRIQWQHSYVYVKIYFVVLDLFDLFCWVPHCFKIVRSLGSMPGKFGSEDLRAPNKSVFVTTICEASSVLKNGLTSSMPKWKIFWNVAGSCASCTDVFLSLETAQEKSTVCGFSTGKQLQPASSTELEITFGTFESIQEKLKCLLIMTKIFI